MSSILAKRPREDDGFGGLGDRGSKKSRCDRSTSCSLNPPLSVQLPFSSAALSIQPADDNARHTGYEDTIPKAFSQWREDKKNNGSWLGRRPPMLTLDTAMDVDAVQPLPLENGDNLSPWPVSARTKASNHPQQSPIPHHLLDQSLTISGGRTSTPIYSHFTVNMRPESVANPFQATKAFKPMDESRWWRRRRLPSPISEAGGVSPAEHEQHDLLENPSKGNPDDNEKLDWPDSPSSMEVDGNTPSNTFLQVPEQDKIDEVVAHAPALANNNNTSNSNSNSNSNSTDSTAGPLPTMCCGTVAPSGNTMVVPKREKISFSMGYRADCEKCQMRVPGHYSHIVRS